MAFKDLVSKAGELTGTATEAAGKMVEEFNQALPIMRSLGFTVEDLRVGMGLVPEIGAKLVASLEAVDVNKIQQMIDQHAENKTLAGALKALLAAHNIRQQIADIPFKGIQIDVTLGLPPKIEVGFVSAAPAAAAAGAA